MTGDATMVKSSDQCKSCGARVIWCETDAGKSMPVDSEPTRGANLLVEERRGRDPLVRVVRPALAFGRTDLHTSHFVSCPDSKRWRKRGPS